MILVFLSPLDLVRCERVCQSWRDGIRSWIALIGLQLHFPYSGEMQDLARKDLLPHQVLKLLVRQDRAFERGEPTSVRRFPHARHWALAGDFVAWADTDANKVQWQCLPSTGGNRKAGKTRVVKLQAWITASRPVRLQYLRLNTDGYLLARIIVDVADETETIYDIVCSLKDDEELVWHLVHEDIPKLSSPELTPLCIGRDRAYFAYKTRNHGYDLVAFKAQTGEKLYQTPLTAEIANGDGDYHRMDHDAPIDLMDFAGSDERIIQFDSDRLMSSLDYSMGPESFSIINGTDGQVMQKIDYAPLAYPEMAKSTTIAIHHQTLQAFSVGIGDYGPDALTLVRNRKPDEYKLSTDAVEEIVFSPTAREEYLTGFHKRKVQRTKAAQEAARKKEREERIRQRKRIREERTHELQEHVRQVNAAIRPDFEDDRPAAVEPVDHEAEYVDEDKYTSVVVEEMDVSREGLRKAHGDDIEEQDQDTQPDKSAQNGKGTASSKTPGKHGQRKDGAVKPKKKRKKFRYESKAERKVTREKERSKNRQQAKARKTK
ncbi:hypothetical protein DV738_g2625, partial [Chaetothyriales sp. CBS 135597]